MAHRRTQPRREIAREEWVEREDGFYDVTVTRLAPLPFVPFRYRETFVAAGPPPVAWLTSDSNPPILALDSEGS